MIHDLRLGGCLSTSLAGYLKALGIHRLVAEQVDPEAQSRWDADGAFHLYSALDAASLVPFFLEAYVPTPIVTPWNGGSGFFAKDQKAGIEAIESSSLGRFAPYRATIRTARRCVAELGLAEKPEKEAKLRLLRLLRARLDDAAIAWLDAACVLGDEARYPVLLGTGGNDGRLEFANNLMQRLADLLLQQPSQRVDFVAARLEVALFGGASADIAEPAAIGQFSPGRAGGPNMSAGLEGKSLVNPWDYVLMLEGSLFFAAAAVRRFDFSGSDSAAAPFQVAVSSVGYGSASAAEKARAELWLPMWGARAGRSELGMLFAEGRLEVAGRRARNGLEAARAVASLGVDRGIDRFQRYAILNRFGRSYLACPVGLLKVQQIARVDLLREIDDVIRNVAGLDNAGPSISGALRRLESAVFDACQVDRPLIDVLAAVGALERVVSRSTKARGKVRPAAWLSRDWLASSDDASSEFCVASAFASWSDMRFEIEPLEAGRLKWAGTNAVWSQRGVFENLVEMSLRRIRGAAGALPLEGHPVMTSRALEALLLGSLDEGRVEDLIFGLALVRERPWPTPSAPTPSFRHATFALLRAVTSPTFLARALAAREKSGNDGELAHPSPKTVASMLVLIRAGDLQGALGLALGRLRAAGITPVAAVRAAGRRTKGELDVLGAALVVPLPRALENHLIASFLEPEDERRDQTEVAHD
jgi:CRISPR-associated protein Csx17